MRFVSAVIISLALHFIIGFCLKTIQAEAPPPSIDTMVEFLEDPPERDEDTKSMVRAQNLPKTQLKERTPEDKARFSSETDQTVLQETRAADNGMTRNRSPIASREQEELGGERVPAESAQTAKPKLNRNLFEIERRPPDPTDILAEEDAVTQNDSSDPNVQRPRQLSDLMPFGLEHGRSTLGENLPSDIRLGEMTALNTDRYLYYSFYARAEELIRHHWERYVRAVLFSYQKKGGATGDEFWVTRIEILLDRDGDFVKGLVHQGSGLQGLDLAPVHAFKDAKQIPHPPPEMVQDDGYIRMQYEFSVRMIGHLASGG